MSNDKNPALWNSAPLRHTWRTLSYQDEVETHSGFFSATLLTKNVATFYNNIRQSNASLKLPNNCPATSQNNWLTHTVTVWQLYLKICLRRAAGDASLSCWISNSAYGVLQNYDRWSVVMRESNNPTDIRLHQYQAYLFNQRARKAQHLHNYKITYPCYWRASRVTDYIRFSQHESHILVVQQGRRMTFPTEICMCIENWINILDDLYLEHTGHKTYSSRFDKKDRRAAETSIAQRM